jgi:acetyl esterase/lipase
VRSLQGRGFRLLPNVRKRLVDWEAPVERFRGMMAGSDRLFKPPPDVQVKPVVTGGVPGEWLIPADASPRSILLYLHGGGWALG